MVRKLFSAMFVLCGAVMIIQCSNPVGTVNGIALLEPKENASFSLNSSVNVRIGVDRLGEDIDSLELRLVSDSATYSWYFPFKVTEGETKEFTGLWKIENVPEPGNYTLSVWGCHLTGKSGNTKGIAVKVVKPVE